MKLHLPVRLFRAIIALMVATPFSAFAVYTAPTVITIPDAFINNQVEVDATDDISQYCKKDEDVAFLLSGDIVFDSLTSQFMTSSAGSWFVTSKSEDELASIAFLTSKTTTTSPSFLLSASDETLTFAYLDKVLFDSIQIDSNGTGAGVISASKLTFTDNKSVHFLNTTTSWYGGVLNVSSLLFENNAEVLIDLNKAGRASAIIGVSQANFIGNDVVKITNNTGCASGGIRASGLINISENTDVLFLSNKAIGDGADYGCGGAISLSTSGSSLEIANNKGKVQFVSNEAFSGGAIWANEGTTVNLHNNEYLEFSSNVANRNSGGGAIYSKAGTKITENEKVVFSGNVSTTTESAGAPLYGGAILSQGLVHIQNNTDVLFDGNSVKSSHTSLDTLRSYGGAIGITNSSSIILEDNTKIVFSNNYVGTETISGLSNGGALYTGGEILIESNGEVEFNNNSIYAKSLYIESSYGNTPYAYSFHGGALMSSKVIINENTGTVSFLGNHAIAVHGRLNRDNGFRAYTYGGTISSTVVAVTSNKSEVSFVGNYAQAVRAYGGAIYGTEVYFSDNSDLKFEGNYAKAYSYNRTYPLYEYRQAFGGAINATNVSFIGNADIEFLNNSAITIPYTSSYEYGKKSLGGAIYASNVAIQNNGNVTFEGNNTLYNTTQTSDSIYQHDATGKLILSSRQGKTIAFYDAFYAAGEVLLNSKCEELAQTGDIRLITQTATTDGMTHLYDGRLRIEYEGNYTGKGMVIHSSVSGESTPTVWLKHGKLTHSDSNIQFQTGSCLELSGMNKITASSLEMQLGSALTFHVVADQMGVSNLTLNGTFAQEGALTLNISFNDTEAEAGLYKLMTVTSIADETLWTSSNVTVNGLDGYVVTFDDLEWKDNTLYLNYDGTPGTGGSGGTTPPLLLIATWTNEAQDGMWNSTSLNWEQDEVDYAYVDDVQVVFGDEGAGTVTLVGDIAPSSVLVDSAEDYTWNADETEGGKLTGSMELTKKGSGSLTINTANDYTGGTAILGGTVVAGTATALGSGAVRVSDASLIIKADGFSNALSTTGNSNIEVQENASLILTERILNTGNLTINGSINASALQLIGTDDTYVDASGHEGSSGFMKAESFYVQVVSGGTVSGNAEVSHGSMFLTLRSDGYATYGGGINYDTYYLKRNASVSVLEAEKASNNLMTKVCMNGGTLYADASVTVDATDGSIVLSEGLLSGSVAGSTRLSASGSAYINSINSHTGGSIFTDAGITLLSASVLGKGSVMTMGNTTLTASVKVVLNSSIFNSGELTLSGLWDVSALELQEEAATRIDINGSSGTSGFFRSALNEVQVVVGGTSYAENLVLSHERLQSGLQLVLSSNGIAYAGGEIDYSNYLLTEGHHASVSEILAASDGALKDITLSGGKLTVDESVTLNATGGRVTIVDGSTLYGSISDTEIITAAGNYNSNIGATIAGESSLTIHGGTITVTGNNSYTEGTSINGGRLEVGSSTALGLGNVSMQDGVLDLNGRPVVNDIFASGGTFVGAENYGGKLTVSGDLLLGGNTSAGGGIALNGGSISGGAIVDTDITVDGVGDMDISSDILGESTLTINGGDVTLNGNNNYTGGTIINGGSLTAGDKSSFGSGSITVNGGTLDLNNQEVGNDINLNNGTLVGNDNYNGNLSIGGDNVAVEGGFTLSAGKVLEIAAGGTEFGSDLTLSGGTLLFKGAPLTVDGEVNFAAGTTTLVDLRSWEGQLTDGLTLAVLGTDVTGWTDGCLELIGMGDMSLAFDDSTGALTLLIGADEPIAETITWLGAKGTVWQTGRAGWMNATTGYDAVFERGSDVIFTQPGTVTIAGAVEPGSMIVAGDKAITFKADKKNPGRIVGEASLTKRGNGKLTLNDGNTYSGGTFIEAGTITAGGANSFGRGDITISGGTLDLKSKAVINDITLSEAATIKGGKKYLGTYTQTGGELMKGSVLNISELAIISGGVVNGTLSGVGKVTIDGDVELGLSGKITTDKLLVNASLSASTKGLVMNSKTSAIDINGGMLVSQGKVSAASLKLNGGSLSLSGALSVKDLTLGSGTLTLKGAKLATVKVGNSLTLEDGTTLNLGFNVKAKDKGKSFKIFTFKTISTSITDITDITDAVLNDLLGLGTDVATLTVDTKRKAITLTVTNVEAWNKYAESVRNGTWTDTPSEDDVLVESAGGAVAAFRLARPVATAAEVNPLLGKVADTLVQSTWGTAGASRAFGDTIAARGTHATALADGKATAWISTMGGSSRISSDGGHAGADYTLTGAAFGMETRLSENSTVGMAIGNSWGKVSTFSAFPVDQDSTHQGIYGKHLLGNSTTLSWMAAHTRTESDANLAGMACDWTQDALQLDARVDKLFAISDRTTVSAFVGMQYLATDKGECDGLSTGSLQNLRGEIGVSVAHKATDKAYVYGELSFIGDMVRNNPTATVGDYRSRGANPGRAGLNLSVGASYQLNDSWSLNGSYSLELMQNQTSHSANVGATYSF